MGIKDKRRERNRRKREGEKEHIFLSRVSF
jgi:hypothetical protein